jgi:NAD(P)-dependent dehydrogenase (short-subunit alcohol dehydrogenase family)
MAGADEGVRHRPTTRSGPHRVSTAFGAETTAAEVVEGVDPTGRRAVVTGASSGIGLETARAAGEDRCRDRVAVRALDAGRRGGGPWRASRRPSATTGSRSRRWTCRTGARPGTPREGWDHSTGYLRRILADVWGADLTVVEREFTLVGVNPALDAFTDQAARLKDAAQSAARNAGRALGADRAA